MSEVSFEIVKRDPMCQYCDEMPASYSVTVKGKGQNGDDQSYLACEGCAQAVRDGLHECGYDCKDDSYHQSLSPMPAEPISQEWLRHRLYAEDGWTGPRWADWMNAGSPDLRLEGGRVVWGDADTTEKAAAVS